MGALALLLALLPGCYLVSSSADDDCAPECDGRSCGDDGCGGTCPPGCGPGLVCHGELDECFCPDGYPACGEVCCPAGRVCIDGSCGCEHTRCGDVCCGRFEACVDGGCAPCEREACGTVCCGEHAVCEEGSCVCEHLGCGDGCCGPSEHCTDGRCEHCRGELCGELCCSVTEECVDGACACPNETCRGACCSATEVCLVEIGECHPVAWWEQLTVETGPAPRERFAMVYDSAREVVVLFGGVALVEGDLPRLDDTWELVDGEWVDVSPGAGPPPMASHAMAYDSAREVVVLFGEGDRDSVLGVTWEYDGASWVEVPTVEAPLARSAPGMAYDARLGRTILYGGSGGGVTYLADTWSFDGDEWTLIETWSEPGERYDASLVYDAGREAVLLVGGMVRSERMGPWALVGDEWRLVPTEAGTSLSDFYFSESTAMYDTRRDVEVLVGQWRPDTVVFELVDGAWYEVSTPDEPLWLAWPRLVYHAGEGVGVYFNGNETWEYHHL